MPRPKPAKLCRACAIANESIHIQPPHLVHPVTRELMLFDVRGEAVCPDCGARWRRERNRIELIE